MGTTGKLMGLLAGVTVLGAAAGLGLGHTLVRTSAAPVQAATPAERAYLDTAIADGNKALAGTGTRVSLTQVGSVTSFGNEDIIPFSALASGANVGEILLVAECPRSDASKCTYKVVDFIQ